MYNICALKKVIHILTPFLLLEENKKKQCVFGRTLPAQKLKIGIINMTKKKAVAKKKTAKRRRR